MSYKVKDLTNVNWRKSSGSLGTNGCYFKTMLVENGVKYYYKLSVFNSAVGFYGHESINEVIVYRLCKILGLECAEFKLVKVLVKIDGELYETFACKSKSYKKEADKAISFEELFIENRQGREATIEFIRRNGMNTFINKMIALDFMIINRDRHGANIEIIKDNAGKLGFAPLFDNGLSFVCSITRDTPRYKDKLNEFNVIKDLPVNNYIGTRSLAENLKYVTQHVTVNKLTMADKSKLFFNMGEAFETEYKEKIWGIVTLRYSYLRKVGIIRERL